MQIEKIIQIQCNNNTNTNIIKKFTNTNNKTHTICVTDEMVVSEMELPGKYWGLTKSYSAFSCELTKTQVLSEAAWQYPTRIDNVFSKPKLL